MIRVTTADGLTHEIESPEAIAAIESPNTRAALQVAYTRGDYEPYTPPEPEPQPPEPNWQDFRLKLLQSETFRDWSERLPATWREDLKLAAMAANEEAVQSIYNHCKTLALPGHTAAAGWQQIATANHIPVNFG